jgi:hypothetical protein
MVGAGAVGGCGDDDGVPAGTDAGDRGDARSGDDAGTVDPDGGPPVPDAGPGDAGVPGCETTRLLVTTSDYVTGELGLVEGDMVRVAPDPAADQDSVPGLAGCTPVVLERGTGTVRILSGTNPLATVRTIDVNPAGAMPPYAANPHSILSIAPDRAYVTRLNTSSIAVIDPSEGGAAAATGSIDLTPLAGTVDTDSVDASAMAKVGDRAFVALGRYFFDAMFAIQFADGGVLAVIDTATDMLVDVDPVAAGVQGIALMGNNPTAIIHDTSRNRLLVHDHGDFFAIDGGIEAIDLETLTSDGMLLTEETAGGEIDGIVLASDAHAWLIVGGEVRRWPLAGGALGDALSIGATTPPATAIAIGGHTLYVASREMSDVGIFQFAAADGAPRAPAGVLPVGDLPPYGIVGIP